MTEYKAFRIVIKNNVDTYYTKFAIIDTYENMCDLLKKTNKLEYISFELEDDSILFLSKERIGNCDFIIEKTIYEEVAQ